MPWSPTPIADLGLLFHRLNNQLGIILANAELLEAKSADEMGRARASQVVASVLDAMVTAKEIRLRTRTVVVGIVDIHMPETVKELTSPARRGPAIAHRFTSQHSR